MQTEQEKKLKEVFGYDSFRPGQGAVVEAILAGRDVLAVMPTGAGKSVCYQVPALLLPGVTLVVSPLISLMQDQVRALVAAGVPAAYLNNSLTDSQKALMLRRAYEGRYKIIYVAPERLQMPGFARFAQEREVSMVTVDEAHCVSQWGHDFRPSYLQIRSFIAQLPARPVVTAFTATATRQVREDIQAQLGLRDPYCLTLGFDRPNLRLETRQLAPQEKDAALVSLILEEGDAPGIVYCGTVHQVEETSRMLTGLGIPAAAYHGKMDADARRKNQEDFLFDRVQVMVATNAFGMGIDKPNVRFVVHYNMPRDLESYYQEAGRAGRDGEPARCVLFYAPWDVGLANYLIDKEKENSAQPLEERMQAAQQARERLKHMTWYATTRRCLRSEILRYFGQDAPACRNCSNCSAGLLAKVAPPRVRPAAPAASAATPRTRPADAALLADLYELRRQLARREKLPAFTVLPDGALRAIAARRPASPADLEDIPGLGAARAGRYGRDILETVRRHK